MYLSIPLCLAHPNDNRLDQSTHGTSLLSAAVCVCMGMYVCEWTGVYERIKQAKRSIELDIERRSQATCWCNRSCKVSRACRPRAASTSRMTKTSFNVQCGVEWRSPASRHSHACVAAAAAVAVAASGAVPLRPWPPCPASWPTAPWPRARLDSVRAAAPIEQWVLVNVVHRRRRHRGVHTSREIKSAVLISCGRQTPSNAQRSMQACSTHRAALLARGLCEDAARTSSISTPVSMPMPCSM